jgi:hypothetical protein
MEDSVLAPMIAARSMLDKKIEEVRVELSVLNKRRDALNTAIDVMRSSDAELEGIGGDKSSEEDVHRGTPGSSDLIEKLVLEYMTSFAPGTRFDRCSLERALLQHGLTCGSARLRDILRSCPQIVVRGERAMTRYFLTKEAE